MTFAGHVEAVPPAVRIAGRGSGIERALRAAVGVASVVVADAVLVFGRIGCVALEAEAVGRRRVDGCSRDVTRVGGLGSPCLDVSGSRCRIGFFAHSRRGH
jgi:hypothetical protein